MKQQNWFKRKFKLRPEVTSGWYWVHLSLIVYILLWALTLFLGKPMFTKASFILYFSLIAIIDIVVHTLLKLD